MTRPTTKASLLHASNEGLRLLLEEIEAVPAAVREECFGAEGGDRTIRDVVCHLHEWHKLMLDWYAEGMAGNKPKMPAEGYTWKTTPELNAVLRAKHQSTSLPEAIDLLERSHAQVQGLIRAHSDEELFTKKHFAWTGSTSLGAYLVSSTSSHYDWALKKVRRFRKQHIGP